MLYPDSWRLPQRPILTALLLLLASAWSLAPADAASQPAQSAAPAQPGWNTPPTLELVSRAIARRSGEATDTALANYAAQGRGYIYFLLDAPELDRQTLVRTDQVALEVYWRSPDQIRQRIVGLRDRRELPVQRLYYYLDRMTVVQDNYGEAIVIADGDNVRDVPHPIAPGALDFYDYRLADSLRLNLPGLDEPVRVREIQVRPKDGSVPAVVGSIFLDANEAALVRMAFTFTPSAYVDPRLDYINVELENGLWRGRFWLPHEQRLEIRREIPELDLPFGTVIRTRMRVGEYEFNQPLPEWLFSGQHPITFVPEEQRRNFPFEEPIDAELRIEGIGQPMEIGEVRREARAILRERAISGLPRGRLGIGSVSEVFRYNRAEGVAIGGGIGLRPSASLVARLHAGWAFGPGHPTLDARLFGGADPRISGRAFLNRMRDVGGADPSSGVANTLGALLFADDWTDPFYASGAEAEITIPFSGPTTVRVSGTLEEHRAAERTATSSLFGSPAEFRPVRPIDAGTYLRLGGALRREISTPTGGRWAELAVGVGRLEAPGSTFEFGEVEARLGLAATLSTRRATLDVTTRVGTLLGDPPIQAVHLSGGRGTLPGYDYRAFGGDRFATAGALASADVLHPWLRLRTSAHAGWIAQGSAGRRAGGLWGVDPTDGAKASLGIGVGLFYDLLHLDLARGFGDRARTELMVEFRPDFWDFL